MRTFFLFLILFAACPVLSLQAQEGGSKRQAISDSDRAAVAAYNEATAALSQKTREARKDIREKNSELANVLARTGADYKEQDVMAAHAALTEAHRAMIEAELEGMLLYKAYHPEWKPEADGRRVSVPAERGGAQGQTDDEPKKEPQAKDK
jgi:hypothetical protein